MGLMQGKRGVIFGVANDKSIAWGVAQQLRQQGAELAFTYLNDALAKRVRPLAESLDSEMILPCDVQDEAQIAAVFEAVAKKWGKIDFFVHALAFANRDDLKNPFSQTSREGFQLALDVSAYSLISMTRAALPVMNDGGGNLFCIDTSVAGEPIVVFWDHTAGGDQVAEVEAKSFSSWLWAQLNDLE